jgi:galactose-6-phosphate isomerase
MATLDVSQVLSSPEFVTRMSYTRNKQTVSDTGRTVNTPTSYSFYGVVTNNSGDTLRRDADGSIIHGDICIHTQTRLVDGKSGRDADAIKYQGNSYLVDNVHDWSAYGQGFVKAICALTPLSGGRDAGQ